MFPWVFCFPKSRIKENGGNPTSSRCFIAEKLGQTVLSLGELILMCPCPLAKSLHKNQ